MSKYTIQVDKDHLERLIKSPLAGLTELIWNSIDADASNINVIIHRSVTGSYESIEISDDGTGITGERANLSFGRLGGSWKSIGTTTDGGRSLHGRAGQGRIRAFGIGESVTWTSTAKSITGELETREISGLRSSLNEVMVTELITAENRSGTRVSIDGLSAATIKWLDTKTAVHYITTTFALAIEKHGLNIMFDNISIDPSSVQKDKTEYLLVLEDIETDNPVTLTIIEWSIAQKHRALLLCDEQGSVLYETKAAIRAPGYHFTAYLNWKDFADYRDILALSDLGAEPISTIVDVAREKLREHFDDRRKAKGKELMEAWKADKTYPYSSPTTNPLEKSTRELFEIVAVAASPVIATADVPSRKLALRLIREALENNPTGLQSVLREVIELPEEQISELAQLLEKTSIGAMIEATRQVTDRLDFLVALEQMIFGQNIRKELLERSQLQRILANETWIFREEYALTADDISLTSALREHVRLLGRSDLEPSDLDSEVLDTNGKRAVVDMMLSRTIETSENRRHHIVIELKRPTVHIGFNQIGQITKYAEAVAGDSRFAMTDTTWEFWIVGDEIDDSARMLTHQKGREVGIVSESSEFPLTIRAVSWAQIIQDARHRLSFIKKSLAYAPTDSSAAAYVNTAYANFLPGASVDSQDPDNVDDGFTQP